MRKHVRQGQPDLGDGLRRVLLATGLLSAGAAMEVFRWMSRHPESPVSQALSWPGHALQRGVTTAEPSEEQMQVARAALSEILRLEGLPEPG